VRGGILILVLVFGTLSAGSAWGKPSRFAERLRAAAETDEEAVEPGEAIEPGEEDGGTIEPHEEAIDPEYRGDGEMEEGGRVPGWGGLPDAEPESELEPRPLPSPSGQKPIERDPAEPARAIPPSAPLE
jgi:hypothetical protein